MNSHRFDICNFSDPSFSSLVACHFNSQNHSITDFSFMPVDVIENNFQRLCKETFWMHKLRTVYPEGMNSKTLFKITQHFTCNWNFHVFRMTRKVCETYYMYFLVCYSFFLLFIFFKIFLYRKSLHLYILQHTSHTVQRLCFGIKRISSHNFPFQTSRNFSLKTS